MISKCQNCGENFNCQAEDSSGCWCMELPAISTFDKDKNCFCPDCLKKRVLPETKSPPVPALKKTDYYIENGRWVFTEAHHLKRGYCCGNRCRHCPFDHINVR